MLLALQNNLLNRQQQYGSDKSVSSPEWSEKVVSRSEGETYGDLTFFFGIDTHYGWHLENPAHADYDRLLADVVEMTDLVGEDYPVGLDGAISAPAFLIHPGDVKALQISAKYNYIEKHYGKKKAQEYLKALLSQP